MQYLQYEFFTTVEDEQQWLIALLSDLPFEGFEETELSLLAFVPADAIGNEDEVRLVLDDNNFTHVPFSITPIEQKNWNEEWEKNFQPVIIAEKVGIRAPFHQVLNTPFELIIEPKMSFGTGHHSTTAGVIEIMLGMNFRGKHVLDMGSGTGVLAILAQKLAASKTVAIDHEEWAYENAKENAERNNVTVDVRLGEAGNNTDEKFDVVLANINRNVIVANIEKWVAMMKPRSEIVLSGFITGDIDAIRTVCNSLNLTEQQLLQKGDWVAMRFILQ